MAAATAKLDCPLCHVFMKKEDGSHNFVCPICLSTFTPYRLKGGVHYTQKHRQRAAWVAEQLTNHASPT